MNVDFEKIKNYIENNTCSMVELEKLLTSIPALAPENGGEGEEKNARRLRSGFCQTE